MTSFYDDVVRLAYSGACNHWAQTSAEFAVDNGVTLIPPAGGYARQEFLDAWPALPLGPGYAEQPAFVLDTHVVEETFERILRYGSNIEAGALKPELRAAQESGDIRRIGTVHINFVVQIAVFGRVVFGL